MSQGTVLVVEDDYLIALDIQDMLMSGGFDTVLIAATCDAAMSALQQHTIRFALLDFNLKNETSAELARHLDGEGVPFLFITGKNRRLFPDDLVHIPILGKPVSWTDIRDWFAGLSGEMSHV